MKNNLLKIVALLMALTMVFGLAACKSGGDSKDNPDNQDSGNYAPHTKIDPSTLKGSTVDVLWWQNLTEDDKKIFENFENEYGMKVNVTETTFSNYSSKLSSMIIAKEGLDLAVGSGFPYSIKQVYNPIDDFGLDLTDEFWDQNYIKSSTYNGKVYAVTSTSSYWFNTCEVLYYNLDFFKNNGLKTPRDYWKENNWNWETLEKICEDIAKLKTDIVPLGYEFTSKAHLLSGTNFNHYDGEKFVSDMDDKRIIDAFSLAYKFSAKKYLGKMEKVIGSYCKDVLSQNPTADKKYAFVTYTTATEGMVAAAKEALTNAGFETIYETKAGATITSHCGENTLGILFLNK